MRRQVVRFGIAAFLASGLGSVTLAQEEKPATKPAAPALTAEQQAKLNEVFATVNGDKITRREVVQYLSQIPISPGDEQAAYNLCIDRLVRARLLTQYLAKAGVVIPKSEVDAEVAEQERFARQNNANLADVLKAAGSSEAELRERLTPSLMWRKYFNDVATDTRLKRFLEESPETFNGTLVKASQIQLNVDESTPLTEKVQAREKLLKIKKEIESGTISFADAANRYSEDPANVEQPSGGDLRWFNRKRFVEPFAVAAFALKKKGDISDPIETEHGMHIIQLTDRKEGSSVQFERFKEQIKTQFGEDEQTRITTEMRKTAKIDLKPMPADLFPKPASEKADKKPEDKKPEDKKTEDKKVEEKKNG